MSPQKCVSTGPIERVEGEAGSGRAWKRRGSMLLGVAETLVQIGPRPLTMARIQEHALKRTCRLYSRAGNAGLWSVDGEPS